MDAIESEGKTVVEAVESALKTMGLGREQVEVQVLQEPAGGFMGFGSKPARVRVSRKRWEQPKETAPRTNVGNPAEHPQERRDRAAARTDQAHAAGNGNSAAAASSEGQPDRSRRLAPADSARNVRDAESLMKELVRRLGISESCVSCRWDDLQERVSVSLNGEEARPLVGYQGRTLEALQSLFGILFSRKFGEATPIQVDALGYWEQREKEILSQAEKGAALVKSSGAPYRLPPMNASLRRMVHKALAKNAEVQTASEGEGPWRKIVLRPRKPS